MAPSSAFAKRALLTLSVYFYIFLTLEADMSDGPHKSLQQPPGWREFSKRCDQPSYEPKDISEAFERALHGDWLREGCHKLAMRIREKICDRAQLALFSGHLGAELECLRRATVGRPMARNFLDGVIEALNAGFATEAALEKAAARTLLERALRGIRSCEEHWLRRETSKRTNFMKLRLRDAVDAADFLAIGRRALDASHQKSNTSEGKRDGLGDGVLLP